MVCLKYVELEPNFFCAKILRSTGSACHVMVAMLVGKKSDWELNFVIMQILRKEIPAWPPCHVGESQE